MLRTLSVQDFVIVDSIELDFDSGFSALTGETGAGKSILIDALALVLGGRADAGMIREGAEKADIRAEFNAADGVADWLKANEINCEDESVLVRRTIDRSGRSRGFVNGVPVTASQMRDLAAMLVFPCYQLWLSVWMGGLNVFTRILVAIPLGSLTAVVVSVVLVRAIGKAAIHELE